MNEEIGDFKKQIKSDFKIIVFILSVICIGCLIYLRVKLYG